jgi:RHS repeat-associated protein
LTSMSYGDAVNGISETRSYNTMNQLTYLGATWGSYPSLQSFSETYNYSSNQNNGQITSVSEGTGETVSYQYDRLKRLTSANSSSGWTQTYGYDGFGNMTSRGPGGLGYFNIQANPATNQMVGFNYDGNGNLHVGNWSYDVENRLVSVDTGGGENYIYDPSNKRVYKQNNTSLGSGGYETYYFYGLDGKVIGEYKVGWCCGSYGTMQLNRVTESAYFGGKNVWPAVARDRLGSVRGNASAANRPYGENYSAQNTDGFATYYQDSSSGLNYADQRYYAAQYGRFNTPDRYKASVGSSDPGSWNRYGYVGNDPVNYMDQGGTERNLVDDDPSPIYAGGIGACGGVGINGLFGNSTGCSAVGGDYGPVTHYSPPPQPNCEDQLTAKLNDYLAGSPLKTEDPGIAAQLVQEGESTGIDPRLFTAIAVAETGGGTTGSAVNGDNNPFGIRGKGIGGFKQFASGAAGIQAAISSLGSTLDWHINTLKQGTVGALYSGNKGIVDPNNHSVWLQTPAYCQGNCSAGLTNVTNDLKSQGGNPNNLAFPCPD